jgi:hypothetical protein
MAASRMISDFGILSPKASEFRQSGGFFGWQRSTNPVKSPLTGVSQRPIINYRMDKGHEPGIKQPALIRDLIPGTGAEINL